MTQYYLHLHECGTVVKDEDGLDLPDLAAARTAATTAARGIMCSEVTEGRLCLSCCIVIEDEQHREVMRINFRDVLEVSGL